MGTLASDSINLKSIKSVTDTAVEAASKAAIAKQDAMVAKAKATQAQTAAAEAAKTATDYIKFEAGTGLIVSQNAEANDGASTVLTDTSLQIRKGGKKSAEFAEDRISFYEQDKKLIDVKSVKEFLQGEYDIKGASIDCGGTGAVNIFANDIEVQGQQGKHAAFTATAGSYNPATLSSRFTSSAADLTAISKSGISVFIVESDTRADNVIASLLHSATLDGIVEPIMQINSKGTITTGRNLESFAGLHFSQVVGSTKSGQGVIYTNFTYADFGIDNPRDVILLMANCYLSGNGNIPTDLTCGWTRTEFWNNPNAQKNSAHTKMKVWVPNSTSYIPVCDLVWAYS